MSEPSKNNALLGEALLETIRQAVRVEIRTALSVNGHGGKGSLRVLINMHKPYLTIKEAAKFSCLGPSTIRLFIRKRELKAHQVGSRVIIKRTDLEGFLESHPIEVISD